MEWTKHGLVFEAPLDLDWVASHAMTPFADRIGQDLFRVYFAGRDTTGRSQIGYFEISIPYAGEPLQVHSAPVLTLGSLGSFDDSGITSSWVVNHDGKKYHYYSGWSLGVTVPFYFYIGLAISEDGGKSFHRVSRSPILDRDSVDPYLTGSPCVLIEDHVWRMWYVSGARWRLENGQPKHYYHIRYAESRDGIHWDRAGTVCIDFKSSEEYAISRPCVIREDDTYKMWYSYRGESYRIGYAESEDGIRWKRRDEEAGIDVSTSGWDSEMIEYPFVFDHKGERYMLYNGNGYGKTGIGLAVLAQKG